MTARAGDSRLNFSRLRRHEPKPHNQANPWKRARDLARVLPQPKGRRERMASFLDTVEPLLDKVRTNDRFIYSPSGTGLLLGQRPP